MASVPVEFLTQPSVADLAVADHHVSGNTDGFFKGSARKSSLIPFLKQKMEQYAVASALEAANADVLIDPQFTYEYKQKGPKLTILSVSVVGYPAVHRNFRTLQYEDIVKMRIEEKNAGKQSYKASQITINAGSDNKN